MLNPDKIVEQAPLPKLILGLSAALADAQNALTMKGLETFIAMADPENGVVIPGDSFKRSLIELGLAPTFLHITEATISARVAFTMAESHSLSAGISGGGTIKVFTASLNAGYAGKFSFETEFTSEVKARIVSVPPPSQLAERLRVQAAKKSP